MKTNDYCNYKLSLALKACGFDEPCDHCYVVDKDTESNIEFTEYASRGKWNSAKIGGSKYPYKHISAPTLWHAQKWLREKKELFIEVSPNFGMRARATFGITSHDFSLFDSRGHIINDMDRSAYPSYEAALSAGIAVALELIEK